MRRVATTAPHAVPAPGSVGHVGKLVLFPLLSCDHERCTHTHWCLAFFAMAIGLEVLLPRSLMAQAISNLGVRVFYGRVARARQFFAAGTPFVPVQRSTIFLVAPFFRASPPR